MVKTLEFLLKRNREQSTTLPLIKPFNWKKKKKKIRFGEFFLRKGSVKKQNPDKNLSDSTFKDSLDRLEFSKTLLQKTKH